MSTSLNLYRLQLLDSHILKIHTRLNEIREELENDEKLQQAKKSLAEAESAHKKTQGILNQAENEVDAQKNKIKQSESTLYSGTVKNPKELEDLQNEIEALKRHLSTLEDRQLEAMVDEESIWASSEAAQITLDEVKIKLSDQNISLSAEQDELNKNNFRLETEREAALLPIDSPILTKYDNLRKEKRNLAVVELSDQACTACGVTLTPAENQSARSATKIFNCPSCGRILFAKQE